MKIQKPAPGDKILVTLRTTYGKTVERGAIVTNVFDNGRVNASVFLDGRNDNGVLVERDGARGGVVWSAAHNLFGELPSPPVEVVGTAPQPVQASWRWPPPADVIEEIEVEA